MPSVLSALWNYRGFVSRSIRNELVSRFERSRLGAFWAILHPLLQVLLFTLVLSNLLAAKLPGIENKHSYALFLMAGTLGWSLFSEILTKSLGLFVSQGNILKKINFPRSTLPIILVGSCLLNNLLLFFCMVAIFAVLGEAPSIHILWILALMPLNALCAASVGLLLGVVNVFLRDLEQIVPIVLQVVFWLTPIVYPLEAVPATYHPLLKYNPLYTLIGSYQSVLVFHASPSIIGLVWLGLGASAILAIGIRLFRRAGPEMVDVL